MRSLLANSLMLVTLAGSLCAASVTDARRAAASGWLAERLQSEITAAQIVSLPQGPLEGCTVLHAQPTPTRLTALSLRCPASALPQLVLLSVPISTTALPMRTLLAPQIRGGATLQADWRTDSLHAQLSVVALEPGRTGDAIRVRVARSSRILRARVLDARTVAILSTGGSR